MMMALNFEVTERAVETKLIGGYSPIEPVCLLETRSANLGWGGELHKDNCA